MTPDLASCLEAVREQVDDIFPWASLIDGVAQIDIDSARTIKYNLGKNMCLTLTLGRQFSHGGPHEDLRVSLTRNTSYIFDDYINPRVPSDLIGCFSCACLSWNETPHFDTPRNMGFPLGNYKVSQHLSVKHKYEPKGIGFAGGDVLKVWRDQPGSDTRVIGHFCLYIHRWAACGGQKPVARLRLRLAAPRRCSGCTSGCNGIPCPTSRAQ